MASNKSNPRLSDVATAAGVSAATVSRFFSNPDTVAAKTAERIRSAVVQTGYTPNRVAGSLASNKSQLVSVMIPQLTSSMFMETIESMVHELSSVGCVVTIGVTEFDPVRSNELIMAALAYRAKAIIVTGEVSPDVRQFIRQSNTTAIEIWDLPDDPIDIAIGFSHTEIGKYLAQFVKNRGYVRPHFISNKGTRAIKRRNGFVDEWQRLDGGHLTEACLDIPLKYAHAHSVFADIQRLPQLPDVVICSSDWLAQGLIIEAQAAGLKVPNDLAVIGFGNSEVAGEMRPTITSIDIDGAKIARQVIEVLEKKDRKESLDTQLFNTGFRLIKRESA